MSRLIDADALKEKLFIADDNWNPVVTEIEIDVAPTAYNVETVLKQLRPLFYAVCGSIDECNSACDCCIIDDIHRRMIEVVKRGGVSNE